MYDDYWQVYGQMPAIMRQRRAEVLEQIDDATYRVISDMLHEGFGIGDVASALQHAGHAQHDAFEMAHAVERDLYDDAYGTIESHR